MGRKSGSPVEAQICWEVINRLEEEDCSRYHHLHHLGDGDVIVVCFRRHPGRQGHDREIPSLPHRSDAVCIFIALSDIYDIHVPS